MMTAGGSVIINGSAGAVKGVPGSTVYADSKAALRSFARTWTTELAGRSIRVNLISPARSTQPPSTASPTRSETRPPQWSVGAGRGDRAADASLRTTPSAGLGEQLRCLSPDGIDIVQIMDRNIQLPEYLVSFFERTLLLAVRGRNDDHLNVDVRRDRGEVALRSHQTGVKLLAKLLDCISPCLYLEGNLFNLVASERPALRDLQCLICDHRKVDQGTDVSTNVELGPRLNEPVGECGTAVGVAQVRDDAGLGECRPARLSLRVDDLPGEYEVERFFYAFGGDRCGFAQLNYVPQVVTELLKPVLPKRRGGHDKPIVCLFASFINPSAYFA